MWWYYLQGLQADLWNSLPPKIASNMYAKIFDHTYGILVGRYAKVEFMIQILLSIAGISLSSFSLCLYQCTSWFYSNHETIFQVTPSVKRLAQFRGDITTLLLIASEALTYIAGSTYQVEHSKSVFVLKSLKLINPELSL